MCQSLSPRGAAGCSSTQSSRGGAIRAQGRSVTPRRGRWLGQAAGQADRTPFLRPCCVKVQNGKSRENSMDILGFGKRVEDSVAGEEPFLHFSMYLTSLLHSGIGDRVSPVTIRTRKTVQRSIFLGNGMMRAVPLQTSTYVRNLCLPEEPSWENTPSSKNGIAKASSFCRDCLLQTTCFRVTRAGSTLTSLMLLEHY